MNHFYDSSFLETRPSSASLEPLIGFLAYLGPKLWLKKQKLDENSSLRKGTLDHIGSKP